MHTKYSTKINTEVGADSLVVSAPTYSTTVLTATRVRFPSLGPLPIPPPFLHPILSCLLSTILSNKKGIKAPEKKYIYKKTTEAINNCVRQAKTGTFPQILQQACCIHFLEKINKEDE